jgi:hypothetical protein
MATIFRDGKVHVIGKECDQCAFSPNRIIPGSRVAGIVRDTKDESGASFVCHKTTIKGGDEDAVCRGWYDRFADTDPIFAMARALGAIEFVREEEVPDATVSGNQDQ